MFSVFVITFKGCLTARLLREEGQLGHFALGPTLLECPKKMDIL